MKTAGIQAIDLTQPPLSKTPVRWHLLGLVRIDCIEDLYLVCFRFDDSSGHLGLEIEAFEAFR